MALTYIEKVITEFPASADDLRKCKELYQNKLWHQLTDSLQHLILTSKCKIDFIHFEAKFIRDFRKYLNTLRYGSLIVQIAQRSYKQAIINEVQGIAFCEQALSSIEDEEKQSKQEQHFDDKKVDNTQSKLLIKTQIALFELNRKIESSAEQEEEQKEEEYANTPFKIAKQKLDEIEAEMESSVRACPPLIYSRYHFVCSRLWKSQQNGNELPSDISWAAMFYKHAMSYLGYTALNQIENTLQWANDIALTALIAPDFYDFGELSLHPIMKALADSEQQWVLDIVNAYIEADISAYTTVMSKYSDQVKANDILRTAKPTNILKEKIKLLSLVRLAFDKAAFERIISFEEIKKVTQCDDGNVEHLIMKAMSLKLVKGIIDEMDKTVNVTWVKPAILDLKQMNAINKKVQVWITKIAETQKEIAPSLRQLLE
eukprot:CAMPEP_0197025006 /NCGR_PEP_ID=MMETSP1384-20130603/5451_1 /TAXON_ID=29189 /ORGANISM="Ammonia sp." /LENGTH=429 /DNA_ID=CAMNT_0042453483 /DNA_START=1618 /DNA_END=2907 /DNA_ORIENTATION=+